MKQGQFYVVCGVWHKERLDGSTIDGEISSLVPGWRYEEDDAISHDYHRHRTTPFHYSSSHSSSSQASLSNYMPRGLQDWLQDAFSSSSHSGSYSNLNYISIDEHSSQPSAMTRTHNMTRFCPEESSHIQSGQSKIYAASSSSDRRQTSDNRLLTRNRSLVDVQSRLLHWSLVEEVRKRRLFKTAGDVETVGFQSPYAVSRKPGKSRR